MQTYKLGDTIRISLELSDESGVGQVTALFQVRRTEEGKSDGFITLQGYGQGAKETTVVLTGEVTDKTIPGNYKCEYIRMIDKAGNQTHEYPDIRFRIENVPGDHEGTKLLNWSFKNE